MAEHCALGWDPRSAAKRRCSAGRETCQWRSMESCEDEKREPMVGGGFEVYLTKRKVERLMPCSAYRVVWLPKVKNRSVGSATCISPPYRLHCINKQKLRSGGASLRRLCKSGYPMFSQRDTCHGICLGRADVRGCGGATNLRARNPPVATRSAGRRDIHA